MKFEFVFVGIYDDGCHFIVHQLTLSQLPALPCLNLLLKRTQPPFRQYYFVTLERRYNVAGAAYDRGDVSEATRHYERVLFLSGNVDVSIIQRLMLCACGCVCVSFNAMHHQKLTRAVLAAHLRV